MKEKFKKLQKDFKKLQRIEPKWLRHLTYFSLVYLVMVAFITQPIIFVGVVCFGLGYFSGSKKQKPARKKTKKKVIRVDEETGEILI